MASTQTNRERWIDRISIQPLLVVFAFAEILSFGGIYSILYKLALHRVVVVVVVIVVVYIQTELGGIQQQRFPSLDQIQFAGTLQYFEQTRPQRNGSTHDNAFADSVDVFSSRSYCRFE